MRYIYFTLFSLLLLSCNGDKQKLTDVSLIEEDDSETPVNAIEQALPEIMIIPSDQLLRKYNSLSVVSIDGADNYVRDYEKFLISKDENKSIISSIQDKFISMDYPLTDFEQSIKSIKKEALLDEVDNISKDAKTFLLTTVAPDIILELDYNFCADIDSRDVRPVLSYTLNAIDTYTNKVFSTISSKGMQGSTIDEAIKNSLNKDFDGFSDNIRSYFAKTIKRGREISVRINIDESSLISLNDENIDGETYSDWIIDYMKTHTKKGTYKLQRNSNKELSFVNVRITTLNQDGTQYNAFDWAREFCKSIKQSCGVKAINKSQGLGEVVITINGM